MSDYDDALSTEEIRQRANSYDGCPTDLFDRWLAEHDRQVRAEFAGRLKANGHLAAAISAFSKLTEAWSHLRMDTPEDQDLHDRLVATSRDALASLDALD